MLTTFENIFGFVENIGKALGNTAGAVREFVDTGNLSEGSKDLLKNQFVPDEGSNTPYALLYRQLVDAEKYELDPAKGGLAGTSLDSIGSFGTRLSVDQKVEVNVSGPGVDSRQLGEGLGRGATDQVNDKLLSQIPVMQ